MSRRTWGRAAAMAVALLAASALSGAPLAGAQENPPPPATPDPDVSDVLEDNDGTTAGVGVTHTTSGSNGSSGGGNAGGPNCTMSDGTPAYIHYEGLQYTTMDEQRNEIRPEEQRPGVYLHRYCGTEWLDFGFYPDAEPVDPVVLAQSVRITPAEPTVRTNPDAGRHLVHLNAWFWVEGVNEVSGSASAGPVTATVSAAPSKILVDPGDGTGAFECPGKGTPYDTGRPEREQSTDCAHSYKTAGEYTATVTVVYDVSFTSNIGVGGSLGTIETVGTSVLQVHESQAIVTGA